MEEKKFYVYLHIRLDNGEPFYVGKGCGNRYKARDNRNQWWKNIVKKYGYDTIFLEEDLTHEEANIKETYWINRIGRKDLGLGTLVNLTNGGDGIRGQIFTAEHREKMRLAKLGKPSNAKGYKQPIGYKHKNLGRVKSNETRAKLSNSLKGREGYWNNKEFSKEHKEKLSKQKMGKDPVNKKYYKVIQLDKKGVFIKEWENQYVAANELNLNARQITLACEGKSKTSQGFIWKIIK